MTRMPPEIVLRPLRELLAGLTSDAIPEIAVRDLALDSRQLSEGALFLACRGTREHGLKHLPQALARGAAAVLWEPAAGVTAPDGAVPAIAVENLSARAGEIAARFFGHPAQKLHGIGITGTDGKTSTAHLLAQALDRLDQPAYYIGTLGWGRHGALRAGDLTTPDAVTLQRQLHRAVQEGCEAVAMEVSSIGLHQSRAAGVRFHTAVLTNVGRDHLDYHGTLENYAAAKRKLFEREELQAIVLNRDDPTGAAWVVEFARLTPQASRLTVYGLDGEAPRGARHVLGRNLHLTASGIGFEVDSHAGRAHIDSRLLGRFNAYNLLAALAALLEKGVALDEACAALSACSTVPGRIEGFRGAHAGPLVVVDYAHTPQALAQVLQAVRAHTAGKLWCVFGCGGDRDRGKRPLMAATAARAADRVIVTDDNPRSEDPAGIVREIWEGFPAGSEPPVIHDRARAIETAVREADADDVVVVAGKGHEDYQVYGSERRMFSDRDFVRALLGPAS